MLDKILENSRKSPEGDKSAIKDPVASTDIAKKMSATIAPKRIEEVAKLPSMSNQSGNNFLMN